MTNQINYITKALQLEIIKPSLQITLNKSELNALIAEALSNPESEAAIKRALSTVLEGKFPQFPEFTNITLGDTAEDGSTTVVLKVPRQIAPKSDAPIKSMDPLVVDDPTPAYVEPEA